jgi:hypothetical protein
MVAAEAEMNVPEAEVRRHAAYWRGFVRFMVLSALGAVIALGGMALFLL